MNFWDGKVFPISAFTENVKCCGNDVENSPFASPDENLAVTKKIL